jgi:hypothetical protein
MPSSRASLNKLGVRRYEQIAAWMQPDVKRIGDALGLEGRINQENWIEQAQVLAKGGETYFATRRARGEAASAAPTPDEGERRSVVGVATVARTVAVTGPTFDSPPEVSDRAAFAAQAAAATLVASPPRLCHPRRRRLLLPCRFAAAACGARRSLAHQRHRCRDREAADLAGRHALLPDRALVAGRRRALRQADRERRTHRPRELDRAGADPEPGGDTKFSLNYDRGGRPDAAAIAPPLKLADAIQEHAATRPARADPAPGRQRRTT